MKWVQTYSGQLINLDSVAYIEVAGLDVVAHFDDSQRLPFLIAQTSNMDEAKDAVLRISRFIEGTKTGYRRAFYSFPEADENRARIAMAFPKEPGGDGPGQPSEANLPKLSLRHVPDDPDGPFHVYADDELVEKLWLNG